MHLEILPRIVADVSLQIFLSIPLRVPPLKTVVIILVVVIPFSRFQKLQKQTSIVVHVPPQRFFCDDHHDEHIYTIFQPIFFFSSSKRERKRRSKGKRGDDIEAGKILEISRQRETSTRERRGRKKQDGGSILKTRFIQLESFKKISLCNFSNRCC